MLDFRNANTLWASVLVETLVRLGLSTAVISPGSRSTPLTVAFARHSRVRAVPILDERSAGFLALGLAKASGRATVLVCTSGTAGANYFPAIIEAFESAIPLLVLTADRPPELRDCASGQTIDQQKLFGAYVRKYTDLALPEAGVKPLSYLRQVISQAWRECHFPVAGPVHLNCPFRDPLAPVQTDMVEDWMSPLNESFFQHLDGTYADQFPPVMRQPLPVQLGHTDRGLIIAGPSQPGEPQAYCRAIATLSNHLGWPVLADGLSPLRNYASLNPHLVTTYDELLRHPHHAEVLVPEQVIQLGALPTSKILRQWLTQTDPQRWIVEVSGRNKDPLHGRSMTLPWALEELTAAVADAVDTIPPYTYTKEWLVREAIARRRLANQFRSLDWLFEGKLSWLLPSLLPPGTPLMIANSMPVRDVEWFWPTNDRGIRPYFNRGANGIDGTLSTALGIALHHGKAVLLTGDLALLHDSNGLLNAAQRDCHLTILLINNYGGGIFESLPIAQFEPPFEDFFATPQRVNFATLAAAHGVPYERVVSWDALSVLLADWPQQGVRLLELQCDRKSDARFREMLLQSLGEFEP